MAKSPRSSRPKTTKPELKPLDSYLAALLNPAINREREGFEEGPQAPFEPASGAEIDPVLAEKFGLDGGSGDDDTSLASEGVSATVAALTKLLTDGNPLFKNG